MTQNDNQTLFDNWYMIASSEYKTPETAYELSGLKSQHMTFSQFKKLFQAKYKLTDGMYRDTYDPEPKLVTDFNDVIHKSMSDEEVAYREHRLAITVEKHRAAMRKYQAKLRAKAKLMTIEKYIDKNPEHAVAYIKDKYSNLL